MATIYGQNFRILEETANPNKYQCIGMATNCTITRQNDTDESSTKDDTGKASKPEVVSKSWSVQVESLNMADVGAIMTKMKNGTKFKLLWDEVQTSDNQTPVSSSPVNIGTGEAYLTDATFQFDDRTNAAKSLQFTGNGAIGTSTTGFSYQTVSAGSYTKGQFVRLFLSDNNSDAPTNVITAPQSLSLHVSVSLEQTTTKDTTGLWVVQEPTGISYDISTSALLRSGETITSEVAGFGIADLQDIYNDGTPVKWKIANVGGDNNRTASSTIVSGSCILTQLEISAQNRTAAKVNVNLNGYGDYTVGS